MGEKCVNDGGKAVHDLGNLLHEFIMDKCMYKELLNYKRDGSCSPGISKEQKYIIRRRSARFILDGKPW